jgi:hypothetical protein
MKQNYRNIIETMLDMPPMGIYGLIYGSKIHLFYTSNIVTALGRILNNGNYRNYILVLIEEITDKNKLRLRYSFNVKEYSNNGFDIINKPKYNTKYKLRIDVLKDFRIKQGPSILVYVKACCRSRRELIVGVFKTLPEAHEFTDMFYAGNIVTDIIYASNDLTKEYINANL